nr:hypothetical protein BaRGS_017986 [Batillaria attramentaria]
MSQHITSDDGGKMKALGECNVGFSLEENDENFEAAEHFEEYYNLSKDHKDDWIQTRVEWQRDVLLQRKPASVCTRIYTTIGKQLETEDPELALGYLLKAYEKAAARDKEGMGRACDAIAKAYNRQGNKEQSIAFLKEFVQLAEDSGMDDELSQACHNLGSVLNSMKPGAAHV